MAAPSIESIDVPTLRAWLADGDELAILDAREQGVYFESHLFHASSVPTSKLEILLPRLVPRLDTRLVWCDDGATPGLAHRAAATAAAMGWTDQHILDGGVRSWADAGGELYSGVNVPSKAFGEFVEQTCGTPHIGAEEVKAHIDAGTDMVILDSRPLGEFRNMSIPTGTDCPGAELVHRVKEMAPDPGTLVVVNCAGRTRSIIGSQSLINAGLENPVVALENGTMGWELAGLEVMRGNESHAPDPSPPARRWAEVAATAVGDRFGVRRVDRAVVDEWLADDRRTTYLLDVRTPEEFVAGHVPGSVSAPGGQLVQATDEYVATRNARLVLIDDNGVRATMTASWLRQLGWDDAVVFADGLDWPLEEGPGPEPDLPPVDRVSVDELAAALDGSDPPAVLDLGSSIKYRKKGHIAGAWWGVRSRLDEARAAIGDAPTLVLTSSDGTVAALAADEAGERWPDARVMVLGGGNRAWNHAGFPMVPGFERPTTEADDVWYKPYDHDDGVPADHMRAYLSWEVELLDQLARDPTVSFPTFT